MDFSQAGSSPKLRSARRIVPGRAGQPHQDRSTTRGRAARGEGAGDARTVAGPCGLALGDAFLRRFRLEATIHSGPTSCVMAAYDARLCRRVALKILHPDAAKCEETRSRFAREARMAARITSLHVVRTLDAAVLSVDVPYIAMEYLEGDTLAAWLDRHGRAPFVRAVDFILQICDALAEAHSLGIVHRDLKPSNVIVLSRGAAANHVKVLDFGVAKDLHTGATDDGPQWDGVQTEAGFTMGTPLYMAPEQMESARDVDASADVWSLGVVLFELLTGRVPFEGRSLVQLHSHIMRRAAPPNLPPSLSCPAALQAVVTRCLSTRPQTRYRDATALTEALAAFGSSLSAAAVARTLEAQRERVA